MTITIRVNCMTSPQCDGVTPMIIAAQFGHKDIVTLLTKLGADVAVNSKHGTAAEAAVRVGHTEVAEKLARYASQCAGCSKKGTEIKLHTCSRCLCTYYCSAACQQQDWTQHKQMCIAVSDADVAAANADAASRRVQTAIVMARKMAQCANCEKKGTDVKLQASSTCLSTYYCSAACEEQDRAHQKQTYDVTTQRSIPLRAMVGVLLLVVAAVIVKWRVSAFK